ncbi:MAG: hypothetical protein IMF19_14195, partial [Proteobacteria bacterium]|nr:hypothetical protein [Pseudomonadota bacterium]
MKNIVAFTVVIIFVMAIVLIAFSCTASAHLINRSFSPTGGVIYYEGGFASGGDAEDEPAQNILIVYNWASGEKAGGEKIKFFTKGNFTRVTVGGPYTKSGKQSTGSEFDLKNVSAGGCWDAEGKKAGSAGYFKVEDDYGNGGWFQVIKQTFTLELGKKKVQEKESFNLTLKSNGREKGVMKLTIEDKDGYSIMNKIGDDIYEIRIDYKDKTNFTYFSNTTKPHQVPIGGISFNDSKLAFNTSKLDMNVGKYKIILEDYATEAEYSVDITVEKRYLKVECEEEVVRGEDIVITISSSFYDGKVNVTFGKEDPMPLTLNEGGEKRVKISTEDLDYGRYRVNVSVSEMMDIKYVMITKSKTSIEVPEDATVGEIVHIKGETSESGDSVIFVIDNVFESEATITDDKFKWDWDTSGELDGYRGIEVFILSDSVKNPFAIGDSVSDDWQREHGVAASSSIILFTPTFSMTVSKSIAKGDPLVING